MLMVMIRKKKKIDETKKDTLECMRRKAVHKGRDEPRRRRASLCLVNGRVAGYGTAAGKL